MKKPLFLFALVAILIVTGVVFFLKFKKDSAVKKAANVSSLEKKKPAANAAVPTMSATGAVVSIDKDKLVLRLNSGDVTLKLAPTPPVRMMSKEGKIDKKITDIKKDSLLMVRYLEDQNRVIDILIYKL